VLEIYMINDFPIYISSCNEDENNKNYIHLKAYIIDNCNYNCYYCYNKKPRAY